MILKRLIIRLVLVFFVITYFLLARYYFTGKTLKERLSDRLQDFRNQKISGLKLGESMVRTKRTLLEDEVLDLYTYASDLDLPPAIFFDDFKRILDERIPENEM